MRLLLTKNNEKNKSFFICIIIIFFLNILLFLPTIGHDFIGDDHVLIVDNPRIKEFGSLIKDLKSPFSLRVDSPLLPYWRPIILLSYYVDYKIWGLKPAGFHLTNIIFNAFNAVLVFLLFFLPAKKPFPAFLVSLLFSLHPAHAESTAWISGRTDVLSAFFILVSISAVILFVKKKKLFFYFLSYLTMVLAFLCKEISLFLPVLISLILMWPATPGKEDPVRHSGDPPSSKGKKAALLLSLPFWLTAVAYVYLHATYTRMPSFIFKTSPGDILNIIKTIGAYTRILFLPFFPAPYFSMREFDKFTVEYILLFVLAIIILVWIIKRRDHFKLSFFSLGALIFLIPVLNPRIIPAYPGISFRFTYISTLFAAVFYTEILYYLKRGPENGKTGGHNKKVRFLSRGLRDGNKLRSLLFVIFLVLLGGSFAVESFYYQVFFKNEQQMDIIINYYPDEEQPLFNIALRKARQGDYHQALGFINAAIEKNKTNPWKSFLVQARLDKARLLLYLDRREEGRALLEQILNTSPETSHRFQAYLRMSEYYELKTDYATAVSMLRKAETMGQTPYLFYRCAYVLSLMGKRREALEIIEKAGTVGMKTSQLEQLGAEIRLQSPL